ncbi:MAG: thiol-disulfide oxidoreductase DCC family protein [Desulfofustis sp.]|nr:thiol-disulfide oxidoreductase DCC family protein [Desulfofustis sp.]NNK57278.1 thiol-disulfide oxidoreductase DCC family protein [Desulfofustis sp.]
MRKTDQPIIIFDGVCSLCEFSVRFIVKHDRQARFKFVSAQSEKGKNLQRMCGVDTLRDGTVILLKNDQVYVNSDAALQIAKNLDGTWRLLYVFRFIPKQARDYFYSIISKNRYRWFGKRNECLLPDDDLKQRFL